MNTPPPAPPAVPIVPGQAPKGLIPAEALLLSSWLNDHFREFDSVEFNVRVGHGTDPGADFSESVRQMHLANSQRRIDALLMQGNLPVIVEVKVRGSLWAIGQLEGYSVLWTRDNPGFPPPKLVLVCGSIDQDTAFVYTFKGIEFAVVDVG